MDNKLFETIEKAIQKDPSNFDKCKDLFDLCVSESTNPEMFETCHFYSSKLRQYISLEMKKTNRLKEFYDLYRKSLLFDAKYSFDAYMLYLEIDRRPNERFYQPRRKILKPLIDAIQDLADDKLDELFISMPPRVGKTAMINFFVSWWIGKYPESTNLYSAVSDFITSSFYDGLLEILTDENTYKWKEVFEKTKIASTNAKQETIDINREKRYPTFTARSLYGTLNGACDCNGILIADDLLSGIEEALNPDRLVKAWVITDNNLLARAKENAKILWVGTRWSTEDPIGKRLNILESGEKFKNHRYRVINIPALNDNDESNFDYPYGVGFSTETYQQKRISFEVVNDMASWYAQYCGQPIERDGTVFVPSDLQYFNGNLPDGEVSTVYMGVDPAWGGGDFVSAPIGVEIEKTIYIVDVLFSNLDKSKTIPMLVDKIVRHNVRQVQVECTSTTEAFAEELQEKLKEKEHSALILKKPAPNNTSKEYRIKEKSPDIICNFVFLDKGFRNKDYNLFMQQVFSFKWEGKNKHDDAPDSLAILSDLIYKKRKVARVYKRPF